MRALQFITDHVIFKLRYNQIYQMKTTYVDQKCQKKINAIVVISYWLHYGFIMKSFYQIPLTWWKIYDNYVGSKLLL